MIHEMAQVPVNAGIENGVSVWIMPTAVFCGERVVIESPLVRDRRFGKTVDYPVIATLQIRIDSESHYMLNDVKDRRDTFTV